MTSLSTRFLGQPRLTKPTFGGWLACGSALSCALLGVVSVNSFKGIESSILASQKPQTPNVGGAIRHHDSHRAQVLVRFKSLLLVLRLSLA